ncbi:MAG: cell wall hydrolase [Marivivens sp.]|jgi:spore germination cell wall hydrolase CwlJ-like protein|nr:cell wall hydrolase [Marivivens sp.]
MTLSRFGKWVRRVVLSGMMIGVAGSVATAEEGLADRLGALLGQERQALSVVPSSRLNALTAPPRADGSATEFPYDRAFLAEMPRADGGPQWECLTEALYFEARGESIPGMFAVGEVILNRVESASFPDTVCRVVNQGTGRKFACQFTYTCDGRLETVSEPKAWVLVGKVARLLMDGAETELTEGATHYHANWVSPSWSRRFARTATIGVHHFYRMPTRTASN